MLQWISLALITNISERVYYSKKYSRVVFLYYCHPLKMVALGTSFAIRQRMFHVKLRSETETFLY